jgi:hypothetical protein
MRRAGGELAARSPDLLKLAAILSASTMVRLSKTLAHHGFSALCTMNEDSE